MIKNVTLSNYYAVLAKSSNIAEVSNETWGLSQNILNIENAVQQNSRPF